MNSMPLRRLPSCISSLRSAAQPICRAVAQIMASQNESRCSSTASMASTRAVSLAEMT